MDLTPSSAQAPTTHDSPADVEMDFMLDCAHDVAQSTAHHDAMDKSPADADAEMDLGPDSLATLEPPVATVIQENQPTPTPRNVKLGQNAIDKLDSDE